MKYFKHFVIILSILFSTSVMSQSVKEFELSKEWLSKIEKIIPSNTNTENTSQKHILIFSLHTGFEHWTIPHTEAVLKIIAEKSGGFQVTVSKDISAFEKGNIQKYDAIVLNNTCSEGDKRDLFWDVLKKDTSLSQDQKTKQAQLLENNLINFVKNGKGLMVMHGGIVMQNKSKQFGEMLGGSFEYHPKQQNIHVKLVDPKHPLVQGFDPNGFVHWDEPYFFDKAYFDYNFKPLLYMESDKIKGKTKEVSDKIKYISWIKKYGKGRVFYSSPSHNAQSMENPALLHYFLRGMLYVTGNLKCDDSRIEVRVGSLKS